MKKTNPYPLATKKNQGRFTNVAWQYEVANGDTKLGYLEWVEHQVVADAYSRLYSHPTQNANEAQL